ncbi:hypothetical protein NE172_17445 [Clostridium botulinum]|uniref:Uncharacterized protein n=1 Tax=Clostridium botulinum TaxID=1491 RepID=A0A6B4JPM2_CLOBO|nr:glycosyl hydrolase family 32, N domain protein [Clostridium botulinum]EES50018.1 glycosyl hydrolase family 32, N domain protein [Clostridium botulinum E1 str. 'BoNT E Beluga']MBY6762601.1 hypothetical protein [Clostridium botulinum]MBY6920950.1 hypothetical protein [Clostridium botulinum]MCR1132709.1 hypothetical protein [Clostridium botulinum]NFJ58948.1 hypothetical protein [Clostridium botulinum]
MLRKKLKKIISFLIITASITTIVPVGATAQWRQANDKTWTYVESNNLAKGWKYINGLWYYFDSNGNMKTDWINDNGTWYYLKESGDMVTGWINHNGTWYYTNNSGAMETGVIEVDGKIYCLATNGFMLTGNVNIDGFIYTFSQSGEAIGDRVPKAIKKFEQSGIEIIINKDLSNEKLKEEFIVEDTNNNSSNSGSSGGSGGGSGSGSSNGSEKPIIPDISGEDKTEESPSAPEVDKGEIEAPDNSGGGNIEEENPGDKEELPSTPEEDKGEIETLDNSGGGNIEEENPGDKEELPSTPEADKGEIEIPDNSGENNTETEKPELSEPNKEIIYPEVFEVPYASQGTNEKAVGDTVYEMLKALGWKVESDDTLSVHSSRVKFENLNGKNDIDSIITIKCGFEDDDKDAIFLLNLMIGPDSSLSFEDLVRIVANGSSTVEDGNRTIKVSYNGKLNYTIKITFSIYK